MSARSSIDNSRVYVAGVDRTTVRSSSSVITGRAIESIDVSYQHIKLYVSGSEATQVSS